MIKLMIVDDESSIRRGLKHYIDWNAWGISLEAEASDGEEAFRTALEVRPDILISDIRMPEKDGLELCSCLEMRCPACVLSCLQGMTGRIIFMQPCKMVCMIICLSLPAQIKLSPVCLSARRRSWRSRTGKPRS